MRMVRSVAEINDLIFEYNLPVLLGCSGQIDDLFFQKVEYLLIEIGSIFFGSVSSDNIEQIIQLLL